MKNKKQDLRVKKTQRALVAAMLTLLETNSFAKITVNDLCVEAMVSRSVFYVHFQDKYALLHFCMDTLKQRLFKESEGMSIKDRIRSVLENIQANVKIFKNLLMTELDAELVEMMRKSFHSNFEHVLATRTHDSITLSGPAEVISIYYASGITSSIMFWVSRNMSYSIDEMTNCLCALLPQLPLEE